MKNLIKIITYIIDRSIKLKNKYINDFDIKVEYCDIFSRNNKECQQLTEAIEKISKKVYVTSNGNIYLLKKPIKTITGKLSLIRIRKPDNKLRFRGDADFNTDYLMLKSKYKNNPNFELIIREKFEMLRLSDPDFDVMTCFSNIPVRKWI